jgi:hypothetical protein
MLPQLHSNPVSINIGLAASFLRRKVANEVSPQTDEVYFRRA